MSRLALYACPPSFSSSNLAYAPGDDQAMEIDAAKFYATLSDWSLPQADWRCSYCGVLNDPIIRKCPMCGASR